MPNKYLLFSVDYMQHLFIKEKTTNLWISCVQFNCYAPATAGAIFYVIIPTIFYLHNSYFLSKFL